MTTPKLRCIEGRLPRLNHIEGESFKNYNTHLSGVSVAWMQGTATNTPYGPIDGESQKAAIFAFGRRHGFPKASKF